MQYYIIWIEGFSSKRGEKIHRFNSFGMTYTTKMTDAKRVKEEDIHVVKAYLKRHGISDWTIENAFVKTSYAPYGTVLNLEQEHL